MGCSPLPGALTAACPLLTGDALPPLQMSALKLLLLLNVAAYCAIVGLTLLLLKGANRVRVIGWINVGFSVSVFAAPLSIMVSAVELTIL